MIRCKVQSHTQHIHQGRPCNVRWQSQLHTSAASQEQLPAKRSTCSSSACPRLQAAQSQRLRVSSDLPQALPPSGTGRLPPQKRAGACAAQAARGSAGCAGRIGYTQHFPALSLQQRVAQVLQLLEHLAGRALQLLGDRALLVGRHLRELLAQVAVDHVLDLRAARPRMGLGAAPART